VRVAHAEQTKASFLLVCRRVSSDIRIYYGFQPKQFRRAIVFNRLLLQLCGNGMANATTTNSLALAAGKVYRGQSAAIQELFLTKGFIFWSPEEIKEKVTALARRSYEDDAAIITAKILLK
jgi:hypothetical protein